jgi:hypothetical protein
MRQRGRDREDCSFRPGQSKKLKKAHPNHDWLQWGAPEILATWGSRLDIKQDAVSKIFNTKRAGGMQGPEFKL